MNGKKKIAFVIQGLGLGGAEKFLISVVNHFYKNGYEPVLFLLSRTQDLLPELDNRIKVVTILKRSRFDLFVVNKIRKGIKAEGITKIFCVNTYAFFLTKLSFLFNTQVKFFISLHSTIPFSKRCYWQNLIYFRFVSKRDTIIYLCNNQKKYLQNKYYLAKDSGCVIYNGIDTQYFNPELFKNLNVTALKKQYGIAEAEKVIILVARLQAEKRHFDAVDALGILHYQYQSPAHLLLVGPAENGYAKSLRRYIAEKELFEFVHFTGSQADVRKYYCMSDVFTLTSNSETFSLAALEAMAFGLPCSLTDVGGAREMTIEGTTGRLSKPQEAVTIASSWYRILKSRLNSKRIRQFVLDNFTDEKMLIQYIKTVGES